MSVEIDSNDVKEKMNGKQENTQVSRSTEIDGNEQGEGSNGVATNSIALFHHNLLMMIHIPSNIALFLCLMYILGHLCMLSDLTVTILQMSSLINIFNLLYVRMVKLNIFLNYSQSSTIL